WQIFSEASDQIGRLPVERVHPHVDRRAPAVASASVINTSAAAVGPDTSAISLSAGMESTSSCAFRKV
ncbi:MAG TPA: hypothetical protein VEZ71_27870, partial [Archangium sp.]|nr:hypothetical protein [Archangium sp.]